MDMQYVKCVFSSAKHIPGHGVLVGCESDVVPIGAALHVLGALPEDYANLEAGTVIYGVCSTYTVTAGTLVFGCLRTRERSHLRISGEWADYRRETQERQPDSKLDHVTPSQILSERPASQEMTVLPVVWNRDQMVSCTVDAALPETEQDVPVRVLVGCKEASHQIGFRVPITGLPKSGGFRKGSIPIGTPVSMRCSGTEIWSGEGGNDTMYVDCEKLAPQR